MSQEESRGVTGKVVSGGEVILGPHLWWSVLEGPSLDLIDGFYSVFLSRLSLLLVVNDYSDKRFNIKVFFG